MEAPFDATKSASDMLNFSGSASDMLAAMKAAGIVLPDAEEAAMKVAAAPASAPEASCGDPSCTVDHDHGGHDHGGHDHGHGHDHHEGGSCCAAAPPEASCGDPSCTVDHDHGGHDHGGHDHGGHDHGHGHDHHEGGSCCAAAPPVLEKGSVVAPPAEPPAAGVLVVDASEASLTLTWAAVAGAVKYELEWRPAGSDEWAKLGSKGFASPLPPKQKNGLAPGAFFDFRLRARDPVDWFPWSPVATHATLTAGAPRLPPVTLQKAEAGALTVAWSGVDPEDHPTAKYELQLREAKDPSWTTVSASLAGPAARKRNLDPNGKYFFRVKPVLASAGGDSGGGSGGAAWAFSAPNTVEFKPVSACPPLFKQLLGATLVDAAGKAYAAEDKLAGKVVALYFSASWCGPCRQFTPQLASLYAQARAAGHKFEVVFVSADRDEPSMKDYLSHMPWLAVPFASPERTATPAQFQVSGIPHLKVFGARGQLLDNDAIRNNSLSLANLATWERGVATAPAHQHSGGGGC